MIPDYEMTNLISDIAGILGITMGLSIIAMYEFLYALVGLAIHATSNQTLSILK